MIEYLLSKRMVILVPLFLLTSIIIVSGYSFAQLEKPVYHVGDYWEYDVTGELSSGLIPISLQGTGRIEILNETTLTVDGDTYEVWKFTRSTETTTDTFNLSMTMHSTLYSRISDLATVKEFTDSEMTSTVGTETSHEEITYITLQPAFDYPINVDDSWERHIEKDITNETGTYTETEDTYYECTGTTEVNTEAGSFSCYIIRADEDDPPGDTYTVDYHSDEVGHTVKRVQYEDGEQTMTMTLTSYNYTGEEPEDENGETPGFEMVILLSSIGLLVMFKRKRK